LREAAEQSQLALDEATEIIVNAVKSKKG